MTTIGVSGFTVEGELMENHRQLVVRDSGPDKALVIIPAITVTVTKNTNTKVKYLHVRVADANEYNVVKTYKAFSANSTGTVSLSAKDYEVTRYDYERLKMFQLQAAVTSSKSAPSATSRSWKTIESAGAHIPTVDLYIVQYNVVAGSYDFDRKYYGYDLELRADTGHPIPEGSVFVGWALSKNSLNRTFEPGGIYKEDKHIDLYPVYRSDFSIYFYDGDGETSSPILASQKIPLAGSNIKLARPEKPMFRLASWNLEPDGSGESYLPGDFISAPNNYDFNLYVQWEPRIKMYSPDGLVKAIVKVFVNDEWCDVNDILAYKDGQWF